MYICIYIFIHTYIHTHIYIYLFIIYNINFWDFHDGPDVRINLITCFQARTHGNRA
jgi:hypothetical protein